MSEEYKLPEGWEYKSLNEIVNYSKGKKPRELSKMKTKEHNVPYINTKYLRFNIIENWCSHEEKLILINESNVLLLWDGANAGEFFLGKDGLLSSTMVKLEPTQNYVNEKYLYFMLKNTESWLRQFVKGSGIPHVSKEVFNKIKIPIPFPNHPEKSLEIQQKIVDKLDLFFQHYETLKEEKQKAVENYDDILAATISKLIPSNEEELPEGWEVVLIGDILPDYKKSMKRGPFGSALKKEFFVEDGYKVYEQRNAIYNDFSLGKYYIDEEKFNELEMFELKTGDLLISCAGTIGKCAIVPEGIKRGVINQALMKITLDNKKLLTNYFYYFFNSIEFQNKIIKGARGSAMKNLASVKEIKELTIGIPFPNDPEKSLKIQREIVEEIEKAKAIQDKINEEKEFIQKQLEDLPKSVLAKAFRGELI